MSRIRPHSWLKTTRPDEIAETWSDVPRDLGRALWASLEGEKPLSERVAIEDCGPHDVIGIASVSKLWRKFTDDEKRALNELAKKQQKFISDLMKGKTIEKV